MNQGDEETKHDDSMTAVESSSNLNIDDTIDQKEPANNTTSSTTGAATVDGGTTATSLQNAHFHQQQKQQQEDESKLEEQQGASFQQPISNSHVEDNHHDLVATKLPRKILHNGNFIHDNSNGNNSNSNTTSNKSSSSIEPKKILFTPTTTSTTATTSYKKDTTFSLSWKNIFSKSLLNHSNEEVNRENERPTTSNDDIESQNNNVPYKSSSLPSSQDFRNEDGLYKPLWQYQSSNYNRCCWGHSQRSASRFERDGILIDNKTGTSNDEEEYFTSASWMRPQDIKSESMMEVNDDVDKALTMHRIRNNETKIYALEVMIDRMKFHNHPFMNEEERMVHELELLYDRYKSLNDRVVLRNLEFRLCANMKDIVNLRSRYNMEHKSINVEKDMGENELVFQLLYHDFVQLTCKMAEFESQVYSIYCMVVKKWDEILKIRERQNFQSTTKLLVQISNNGFNESSDEAFLSVIDNFRMVLKWFASEIETADDASTEHHLLNMLETIALVHSSYISRVDIFLTKNEDSHLTCQLEYVRERKRRDKIRSEGYVAKLLIDDEVVETTSVSPLNWPSLQVNFKRIMEVVLDGHPKIVSIQLYLRKFGVSDMHISTVYVTIPEQTSDFQRISLELMSPSVDWYHFSETKPQKNLYNRPRKEGSILISTQWKKVDESKSINFLNRDEIIKPLSSINIVHQSSNDYNQNDQRYIEANGDQGESFDDVLTTMKPSIRAALNDESMRFKLKGTKHSYFNSSLVKEPLRHQLMKQRMKNLFSNSDNTPIPLNEWDIAAEVTQLATETRIQSRTDQVSLFTFIAHSLTILSFFEAHNNIFLLLCYSRI